MLMSKREQFFRPRAIAAGAVASKGLLVDARAAQLVPAASHGPLPDRAGGRIGQSSIVTHALDDAPQATGALISYIQRRYHDSHRHDLAELICLAILVEARHGGNPEAPQGIIALLSRIHTRLAAEMQQDENVLFPLMLSRERPTMALLINQAKVGHHALLDFLGELRELIGGDKADAAADGPWRALCFGAKEFADELVAHIYLKDQVLFPRFR